MPGWILTVDFEDRICRGFDHSYSFLHYPRAFCWLPLFCTQTAGGIHLLWFALGDGRVTKPLHDTLMHHFFKYISPITQLIALILNNCCLAVEVL